MRERRTKCGNPGTPPRHSRGRRGNPEKNKARPIPLHPPHVIPAPRCVIPASPRHSRAPNVIPANPHRHSRGRGNPATRKQPFPSAPRPPRSAIAEAACFVFLSVPADAGTQGHKNNRHYLAPLAHPGPLPAASACFIFLSVPADAGTQCHKNNRLPRAPRPPRSAMRGSGVLCFTLDSRVPLRHDRGLCGNPGP